MRRNGTFLICGNFSATVADVASDVCIFGDAFFDDGFLGVYDNINVEHPTNYSRT